MERPSSIFIELLLIFLLFNAEDSCGQTQIKGRGATFPAPVYAEWIFAYSLVKPDVDIDYTASGSGDGLNSMRRAVPEVDFAGSDAVLRESDYVQYPNLRMFPVLAAALVPVYNLPSLSSTDPKLFIDRDVMVDIFAGRITHWRHPRILATNTEIQNKLPNATITVVVRQDGSGTTEIFTSSLTSIAATTSTTWPYNTFISWPSNLTTLPNFRTSRGNQGVFATVINTENSVGYIALPAFSRAESYDGVAMALMRNRNGFVVNPENNTLVENAQRTARFNMRFNADIQDPMGNDVWPMAGYTYIIYQDEFNDKCMTRRELFKWFNWLLTNPGARTRANALGYSALPIEITEKVLDQLRLVKCRDDYLLANQTLDQHTSPMYEILISFCGVIIALLLGIMIRSHKPSKTSTIYTLLTAFAAVVCFIAVIFWYIIPNEESVCLLRQWITSIGIVSILSVVEASRWQLFRIPKNDPTNVTTEEIPPKIQEKLASKSWIFLIISIMIQIIIQSLWSTIDPYKSTEVIIDKIDLRTRWECKSEYITVWGSLVVSHIIILMIVSLYISYDLHTLRGRARNEVRWNNINIYNMIIILSVLQLPIVLSDNDDDDNRDWNYMLLISSYTISNLLSVTLPSYIRKSKRSSRRKMIIKYLQNQQQDGGTININDIPLKSLKHGTIVKAVDQPKQNNSSGNNSNSFEDR